MAAGLRPDARDSRSLTIIDTHRCVPAFLALACTLAAGAARAADDADKVTVYATFGVHNPPAFSEGGCKYPECVYPRQQGEPTSDPQFPVFWTARWTMYRVFNGYADFPPPYDGTPPAALHKGKDYEVSYGATYYDSTWKGHSGEGAMMEYYEKRCLPIFPISNHFTCSFISLGDIAYFVTYKEDRPAGMPAVCLFSDLNHPPRRDFISHLPYSADDSARLDKKVQGYSFWVDPATNIPVRTGVSPDLTAQGKIMFGYAFWSEPTLDLKPGGEKLAPYKHPQSFYFSGYPLPPANAPIVSQNYTEFNRIQPDPRETWDQVSGLDPHTLPACQLFNPPKPVVGAQAAEQKRAPTWGDLVPRH